MQIPIAEFLERLHCHLETFPDETIYPPELRCELLAYYQQFIEIGNQIEQLDPDLLKRLKE